MRLLTSMVVATVVTSPMTARADVYGDARDIIQELVKRDLAKNVVPNAAARIPTLCDYFPSSLAALQQLRFNGLPGVIHKEISDAIGFKVLILLRPPNKSSTLYKGLSADVSDAMRLKYNVLVQLPETPFNIEGLDSIKRLQSATANPQQPVSQCKGLQKNGQDSWPPRFSDLESIASQQLARCVSAQTTFEDEVACSLALLTRDAALIDKAGVANNLRRAAAAVAVATVKGKIEAVAVIAEAMRSGKLDLATIEQLVKDGSLPGKVEDLWKVMSALLAGEVDETTIESALSLISTLATKCDHAACKQIASLAQNPEVGRLLRLLQARDYGGAADAAMKILIHVACEHNCSEVEERSLIFVQKLAVYTIDSIQSGSASSSVSADFRDAAIELIELVSGPGIARARMISVEHFSPKELIIPRFALRKASRPGSAPAGFVNYPSVDLANFRWVPKYSEWLYLGINLSLFDALGPFTELAVRAPELSGKGRASIFMLGFATHRLDVEIGVPNLTTHLAVGAGAAFRFYRAETTMTGVDYCVLSDCAGDKVNANNFDFNVFVKYVP